MKTRAKRSKHFATPGNKHNYCTNSGIKWKYNEVAQSIFSFGAVLTKFELTPLYVFGAVAFKPIDIIKNITHIFELKSFSMKGGDTHTR